MTLRQRCQLICVALLFLAVPSVAVFDPTVPRLVENFDPAEADPFHNLTCLGPLPQWPLPILPDFDPNIFTLQELCAKPQYGGRARGQHLGLFALTTWTSEDRLSFDRSAGALTATALVNPRLQLYCRMRCYAHRGSPDLTLQPDISTNAYTNPWHFMDNPQRTSHYLIKVDVLDDYIVPPTRDFAVKAFHHWTTVLYHGTQVGPSQRSHKTVISVDEGNRVVCTGPLPNWPLPDAWSYQYIRSQQHLCAVELSGGFFGANAGGYCHRNSDGSSEVWFADEMTPRLEWTWDNFRASAAIRNHCYRSCRCADLSEPMNGTVDALWNFLEDADIVEGEDGSVSAQTSSAGSIGPRDIPILEAFYGSSEGSSSGSTSRPAGTCGTDGRQFCPTPWPTALLGDKSQLLAPPRRSRRPAPPSTNGSPPTPGSLPVPQCGAQCLSNRDCRGDGSPTGCRCVAVGMADARAQGLDPVFPQAACLLATLAVAKAKPRIGGRRRGVQPDALASSIACACNQTYVSRACCEKVDGLVWEAPGMKLGRLGRSERESWDDSL
ncbi:MAG: hypothetical protein M1817_002061 [Caeruleum heppii]|nr:MAG: hypothetical protein M1817_002061 [Caeruleum heppii]